MCLHIAKMQWLNYMAQQAKQEAVLAPQDRPSLDSMAGESFFYNTSRIRWGFFFGAALIRVASRQLNLIYFCPTLGQGGKSNVSLLAPLCSRFYFALPPGPLVSAFVL